MKKHLAKISLTPISSYVITFVWGLLPAVLKSGNGSNFISHCFVNGITNHVDKMSPSYVSGTVLFSNGISASMIFETTHVLTYM